MSEATSNLRIRTPQEIIDLKTDWIFDRCFVLENALGFENHREELSAWRCQIEAEERREDVRLAQRAAALDCSISLVRHIETLEERLRSADRLKKKVDAIQMEVGPTTDPDTINYRLKRLEDVVF